VLLPELDRVLLCVLSVRLVRVERWVLVVLGERTSLVFLSVLPERMLLVEELPSIRVFLVVLPEESEDVERVLVCEVALDCIPGFVRLVEYPLLPLT